MLLLLLRAAAGRPVVRLRAPKVLLSQVVQAGHLAEEAQLRGGLPALLLERGALWAEAAAAAAAASSPLLLLLALLLLLGRRLLVVGRLLVVQAVEWDAAGQGRLLVGGRRGLVGRCGRLVSARRLLVVQRGRGAGRQGRRRLLRVAARLWERGPG